LRWDNDTEAPVRDSEGESHFCGADAATFSCHEKSGPASATMNRPPVAAIFVLPDSAFTQKVHDFGQKRLNAAGLADLIGQVTDGKKKAQDLRSKVGVDSQPSD
jgi:hypothetical protein